MRPVIGITADVEGERLILNRQYASSVEDAGGCPLLLIPSRNIPELAGRIDALIIPGGADLHPSYYGENPDYEMKIVGREKSDFELSLVREIIRSRKPLLGICYGMQLINVALGGSLYQDIKAQVPLALDHRKDYHSIEIVANKFVGNGEFKVNTSHHQAVKVLGNGLKAIAFSEDGVTEAFCLDGYPFLLGVQWHPERLKDSLSENIFRSFVEFSNAGK